MSALPFKAQDRLEPFQIDLPAADAADFMSVVGDDADYAGAVSAVAVVSKSIGLLVRSVGRLADGAMHISEDIEVISAPPVGAKLTCQPVVTAARERGGNALVKITKIFTDEAGAEVIKADSFLSFTLPE